jgi:hypothetical protein
VQTSTTYGSAVPPAPGPRTFPGVTRAPFRAEARRPFQARLLGACTPYRAGPVCRTGPGLYALPGRASVPYRAGPVRPTRLGRAGLHILPGRASVPFRAEPAHLSGRGRPSNMRVTYTLQSGPGIFSKYLWIKYLKTVPTYGPFRRGCLLCERRIITRKTLTRSWPGGT